MPCEWAIDASHSEMETLDHASYFLRYRTHVVDQKGDRVRDVIETKEGTVARLILRDGRPLTAEEDAAERQRLNDMLNSPDSYARHAKSEAANKKMAADLIQLMPDAMIYTFTAGQPQARPNHTGEEIVLDFTPNPDWKPPTTVATALTGLQGRLWIDVKTREMVRMEGHIFKPVNFGWGMLAHVFPGGTVSLEQTNIGGKRLIYTHFVEDLDVRALMVKTIKVQSTIDASDFQMFTQPVDYQQAVRQLLDTPLPTH